MKNLVYLAIIIFPLSSLADEFEGSIKFKIEYEITDARIEGRDLSIENGGAYEKFYTKTKTLVKYDIGVIEQYDSEEKKARIRLPDGTNLIGNVTKDRVEIQKISDISSSEYILGCALKAIRVEYSDLTYTDLHYCDRMKVNESLYKDYVLSGNDKIYSKINGIPLKVFRKSHFYNTTTTAYEKNENKIDNRIFEYSSNLSWEVLPDF